MAAQACSGLCRLVQAVFLDLCIAWQQCMHASTPAVAGQCAELLQSCDHDVLKLHVLQDPSFNPFGYARLATRAASSEGGAAAACPTNVQSFFKTIFSMGNSSQGIQRIHQQLNLCRSSLPINSYNDVNSTLAPFFRVLWTVGVRLCARKNLLAAPTALCTLYTAALCLTGQKCPAQAAMHGIACSVTVYTLSQTYWQGGKGCGGQGGWGGGEGVVQGKAGKVSKHA